MRSKYRPIYIKKLAPLKFVEHVEKNTELLNHSPQTQPRNFAHLSKAEIFYAQINAGFWLISIANLEKADTCLVFQPKNSSEKYYSINCYQADHQLGYETNDRIQWANDFIVFTTPGTIHKIFVREDVSLKCHHLIFTSSYFSQLIDLNNGSLLNSELGKIFQLDKGIYVFINYKRILG